MWINVYKRGNYKTFVLLAVLSTMIPHLKLWFENGPSQQFDRLLIMIGILGVLQLCSCLLRVGFLSEMFALMGFTLAPLWGQASLQGKALEERLVFLAITTTLGFYLQLVNDTESRLSELPRQDGILRKSLARGASPH